MATLTPRKNKNGEIYAYRIKVSCGYDTSGKQVIQSTTWKIPENLKSEKVIQRELQKFASEFENNVLNGQTVCIQKFSEFCEKWFTDYAPRCLKIATIEKARQLSTRALQKLGHLRIDRITPVTIDNFIQWLCNEKKMCKVYGKVKDSFNLENYLKDNNISQKSLAKSAGLTQKSIRYAREHKQVVWESAEKIAKALGKPASRIFDKIDNAEPLSPKTIKNTVSFVSGIFDYAIHLHVIKFNPCQNAVIPKVPKPEMKMFTIEEAHRFLDILSEDETPVKYRAFYEIAIFGGLREGEILGLRWSDIDFDNNIIHIRRTQGYSSEQGYYYNEPKTKSGIRDIVLPECAMFAIKQLRNYQSSQRLNLGDQWHNTEQLFTTWNGNPMSTGAPFAWLKSTCEKYNLPHVNIHSFRHLNATMLISSGADVKSVQHILGHSEASTTLDIYASCFEEQQAKALGAVADILTAGTSLDTKAK